MSLEHLEERNEIGHANASNTCVFCEIVSGTAHAHVVAETALAMAILDIQPLSRGHCLVIPKRHVPWWHEMSDEETSSVFQLARSVSGQLMRAFSPDMVTMYARGRRIPHTHIFLVPTFASDPLDRFFNALEAVQESPPDLAAMRTLDDRAAVARLLART